MNARKAVEVGLMWLAATSLLLTGCVSQGGAPIQDGEVFNLFPRFTAWLVTEGDALVKQFVNPVTGISVFARPFQDGWAVAWGKGQTYFGYFMNNATWTDLSTWMTATGGFANITKFISNVASMPIFAVPIIMPEGGEVQHAWDVFHVWMPNSGCGEWDNGSWGCGE